MERRFSIEYILSHKEKYYELPPINKKYIIKTHKKKKKKKEIVHSIDNPWLSTKEKKKKYMNTWEYRKNINFLEETKLKLISLLNKLSEKNFDLIVNKIIKLNIQNEKYLETLTNVVYEKCISEKTFIKLYVNVAKKIMNKWASFDDNKISFIQILIGKCHTCYIQWNNVNDNNKRNIINNFCLIGELFNSNIISYKIISECIYELLNCDQQNKNWGLELLCNLLIIVGKNYEKVNYHDLNKCLNKLQNENNISSKIKFLIMDVLDLHKNNWNTSEHKIISSNQKLLPDDKLYKNIENILLEYLNILDIIEVQEYYFEYNSPNKETIFCNVLVNMYIETTIENKEYLIKLIEHLLNNNYISNKCLNLCFSKVIINKKEYAIDFPNIDNDINNFQTVLQKN